MPPQWILRCAALCALAAAAWADSLPRNARQLLREYAISRAPDDLNDLTGTDLLSFYIHDRLVEEHGPDKISITPFRRDLQLGSFTSTGASTSVIARTGLTDLASAAIESGAVGRKSDDKAATFSFNALPIYQLLSGRMPAGCGSADADCEKGPGRWIRGLSGSVSVSLSNPVTAVPAETPSAAPALPGGVGGFLLGGRQLTALSVRYELFVRERGDKEAQKAVDAAARELSKPAEEFLKAQAPFETSLQQILEAAGWVQDTRNEMAEAAARAGVTPADLEALLLERYRLAYDLALSTEELRTARTAAARAKLAYIKAQNKELAVKLYRKAFTADYLHQRPTDQPWLHQIRLVASTPLGKPPEPGESRAALAPSVSMILNAGVTFYGKTGETAVKSRVRDAQASLAFDWSPAAWGAIRPTYTAAYYFQYMIENGVIEFNKEAVTPGGAAIVLPRAAVEVLNTRGPIHIAQLRVSIPVGDSGVAFPAALSYSNRTELITGRPFWQGHIGVSYDLGSLKKLIGSRAGGE